MKTNRFQVAALEARFDVSTYIEAYEPKRSDDHYVLTCPHCEGKDKLWVRATAKPSAPAGTFICYRCNDDGDGEGRGRGPLELIQWLDDVSFADAIEILSQHAGGVQATPAFIADVERALADVDRLTPSHEDAEAPTIRLPLDFTPAREGKKLPAYFRERGISMERALAYGLGWCQGGRYRNRLIVPVKLDGRLVSFQARYMRATPPDGIKKSLFPKGAKTSRTLFNYESASQRKRIVVVEDPFSAMHLGRSAVATLGTHLSRTQLTLLLRSAADEIVILWDRDAYDKALTLGETLRRLYTVRVVKLPDARDPDELHIDDVAARIGSTAPLRHGDAFAARVRSALGELDYIPSRK